MHVKSATREKPKVDRVACPKLIKKFIDPDADLLFVPADEVLAVAEREGALPYDVPEMWNWDIMAAAHQSSLSLASTS